MESLVLRLSKVLILLTVLLGMSIPIFGDTTTETAELLPKSIGNFRKVSTTTTASRLDHSFIPDNAAALVDTQVAEYSGGNGSRASVEILRFRNDGEAYELFSLLWQETFMLNDAANVKTDIGNMGFVTSDGVSFVKGANVVRIKNLNAKSLNLDELAQGLSAGLDKGEGDIPVLLRHLPNPEESFKHAVYFNSFADLSRLPFNPPVLSAVQTSGNADAALARYARANYVLIIEYHTPQLATENDQRIIARIHELWKLGQPAPTAYKRVGNYSVFVFDFSGAPDEQAAKKLIDEVKYEQVVQWLGENPNIYKEAQKRYINTTLGVLVAVLKASGYALVACLGLGGLIGGLLFTYRRAQQKAVTFSDAGGMLRLNLDELTVAHTDPGRLLRERN